MLLHFICYHFPPETADGPVDHILRSGRFNSSSLPEDYDIAQLSKDLDFYHLPPWEKLIESVDARVLGFMSDSCLAVGIDGMLKQIYEGHVQRLLDNPSRFLLDWSKSGELAARVVPPSSDPWAQYRSGKLVEAKGIHFSDGTWRRMRSLLRKRGFEAERKATVNGTEISISW